MGQAVQFWFDGDGDGAVRGLWGRLEQAGVPSVASRTHGRHRPQVTFAAAGTVPARAREDLAADLRLLSIPTLWLATLAAAPAPDTGLMLAAVVDTELLAVHSTVHDVLAKRVRSPSAYHLPGSWVPHCALAQGIEPNQVVAGFAALHPVTPIRARVSEVALVDTHTGEAQTLLRLNG